MADYKTIANYLKIIQDITLTCSGSNIEDLKKQKDELSINLGLRERSSNKSNCKDLKKITIDNNIEDILKLEIEERTDIIVYVNSSIKRKEIFDELEQFKCIKHIYKNKKIKTTFNEILKDKIKDYSKNNKKINIKYKKNILKIKGMSLNEFYSICSGETVISIVDNYINGIHYPDDKVISVIYNVEETCISENLALNVDKFIRNVNKNKKNKIICNFKNY